MPLHVHFEHEHKVVLIYKGGGIQNGNLQSRNTVTLFYIDPA